MEILLSILLSIVYVLLSLIILVGYDLFIKIRALYYMLLGRFDLKQYAHQCIDEMDIIFGKLDKLL